jgi:hypothetical protein
MKIVSTAAGGGRRTLWSEELMSAHYDPPGVVFEPAAEHGHAIDHPVAECRKEVGEALIERRDHIRALDDVASEPSDAESDDRSGETEGADGGAEPAESVDPEAFVETRTVPAVRDARATGGFADQLAAIREAASAAVERVRDAGAILARELGIADTGTDTDTDTAAENTES